MITIDDLLSYGFERALGVSTAMMQLKSGPNLVLVTQSDEKSYSVFLFSDQTNSPDDPYRTFDDVDLATALAIARGVVNTHIINETGESVDDTFIHDGIAISNPFESSCGRFAVSDPITEYGDAYVQWRDNPPVTTPTPKP